MTHVIIRNRTLTASLFIAALVGCDGSSKVGEVGSEGTRVELQSIEVGRLVDVYSYQRVDLDQGDRRQRANRRLELVARNVVVNANIQSQALFDASGDPVGSANYEFLPFDKSVGHEELLILWDDRPGPEQSNFQAALLAAQNGLGSVPAAYRGQSTQARPIPVVPRNAAIRLKFSQSLAVDDSFFFANPSAIQVLEFKGDPAVVNPTDAFRILPVRPIVDGDSIILDTTILSGESSATELSPGLPLSSDSITANIRIAMPSRGGIAATFFVNEDSVAPLNGVDSSGRPAVVRDFRSGNLSDGPAGRLSEPELPRIITSLDMGIVGVDAGTNVIRLAKRGNLVPVRGRYPFVDGPLNAPAVARPPLADLLSASPSADAKAYLLALSRSLPLGPLSSPVEQPLSSGDFITQTVTLASGERVTLRAEVLENLGVATTVDQPSLGLALAPVAGDSGQGELSPVISVRVSTVTPFRDSASNLVSFVSNATPEGEGCVVRVNYNESVRFTGSGTVLSDRAWRNLFVRIDPKPSSATSEVEPGASLAIEFNKPIDLDQVDNSANLLITSVPTSIESFTAQMTDAKRAKTRIVPTRLSDLSGDGSVLRLQPPLGFFHRNGQAEAYSFHVRLGVSGVLDLAGNPIRINDDSAAPEASWSVDFSLNPAAANNLVGWTIYPFEDIDEDGTRPGSIDIFGQYRLEGGRLVAASGVRFSRSADSQNLGGIARISRGECWDTVGNVQLFPTAATAPTDHQGAPHPGVLYWEAQMSSVIAPPAVPQVYDYWQFVPQPVGRVVEPLKPQGSRMQMRYIEDDFSLSYTQPSEFAIDVEQLYWSPFNDETVLFDVFDRFTMTLGHAKRRPDLHFNVFTPAPPPPPAPPLPPVCQFNCAGMNSSLALEFGDNLLEGTAGVEVFKDAIYRINPNEAFRTIDQVKYVPFPRFDRSYTWRDSRLVTVDDAGAVIGLGGALAPGNPVPNDDRTTNIDSPWIPSAPPAAFPGPVWVMDEGDFRGDRARDHDPIALPLLVDFKVFADNAVNGIVNGNNGFQVALLGPPPLAFPGQPGGYYDGLPSGCGGRPAWSRVRVQASGGFDLILPTQQIFIDPANQLIAQSSIVKDAGLGNPAAALFAAPAGDGMLNWARADFVRKESTMVFPFFDTLQPQRAEIADITGVFNAENGIPDLVAVSDLLRIRDLVVQIDPPQTRQPAGTSVVVEVRCAETFANSGVLYDPASATAANPETVANRGNLLNVNYACEAYRHSTANTAGAARVPATLLTRYVTEDQISRIRRPDGLLPRFMNVRLSMSNNVDVAPPLSPSLRSLSLVYRLQPGQ